MCVSVICACVCACVCLRRADGSSLSLTCSDSSAKSAMPSLEVGKSKV